MTLPASDNFTGTDGTALTTYSVNWSNNYGAFKLNSNSLAPNIVSEDCAAHWNADTFDDDQYAEATITALGPDDYIGVAVRCAAAGLTCVFAYSNSNDATYLAQFVAGADTLIAMPAVFAVGDVMRLEVSGTAVTLKKNGTTIATGTTTLTTGYAGVMGTGNGTASRLDGWTAGNLSATEYPVAAWFKRRPAMMIDSWRMATQWAGFIPSVFRQLRSAPHRTFLNLWPRPTPRRVSGCTV